VIIVSLVGFGLLGLNSQRIDYDAEFDSKLFPIDKPTAQGVCVPIEDAGAYVPLNYKFDDKFNYLIKATDSHINFTIKFAYTGMSRTHKNYTNSLTYEALLPHNTETYFWPSPVLQTLKVKGTGFLIIKKIPPGADIPQARIYKPSTYRIKQEDSWEYRDMGYSIKVGDLFWIRNQESKQFTIGWAHDGGSAGFAVWAHASGVYGKTQFGGAGGKMRLLIPKNYKSKIKVSLKKVGSFKNISLLSRW